MIGTAADAYCDGNGCNKGSSLFDLSELTSVEMTETGSLFTRQIFLSGSEFHPFRCDVIMVTRVLQSNNPVYYHNKAVRKIYSKHNN